MIIYTDKNVCILICGKRGLINHIIFISTKINSLKINIRIYKLTANITCIIFSVLKYLKILKLFSWIKFIVLKFCYAIVQFKEEYHFRDYSFFLQAVRERLCCLPCSHFILTLQLPFPNGGIFHPRFFFANFTKSQ